MAITTVDDIKEFLDITYSNFDTQIEKLIPLCEQEYLDIRNAPWDLENNIIKYPAGSDVTIALMVQYNLNNLQSKGKGQIISENIDSYSVSYQDSGLTGGYPRMITSRIKRYFRGD